MRWRGCWAARQRYYRTIIVVVVVVVVVVVQAILGHPWIPNPYQCYPPPPPRRFFPTLLPNNHPSHLSPCNSRLSSSTLPRWHKWVNDLRYLRSRFPRRRRNCWWLDLDRWLWVEEEDKKTTTMTMTLNYGFKRHSSPRRSFERNRAKLVPPTPPTHTITSPFPLTSH